MSAAATAPRPPAVTLIEPGAHFYDIAAGIVYVYVRFRLGCNVHVVRREDSHLTQRLTAKEFERLTPVTFTTEAR